MTRMAAAVSAALAWDDDDSLRWCWLYECGCGCDCVQVIPSPGSDQQSRRILDRHGIRILVKQVSGQQARGKPPPRPPIRSSFIQAPEPWR